MLRDLIGTFAKIDPSRLDASDVARFASIVRDSARFDGRQVARRGSRLARRSGSYIAAHPRQTGLGLGGIALLGLGAYAAYRFATSPRGEALADEARDKADEVIQTAKRKVEEVA